MSDFSEAFQEHEVQRVLRAYPDTVSTDIHCDASSGLWNGLPDKPFAKCSKIRINPDDTLDVNSEHMNAFIGMFFVDDKYVYKCLTCFEYSI